MNEGGSLLDQFERHGDTASPPSEAYWCGNNCRCRGRCAAEGTGEPGVWLAYYSDWSGFMVFPAEVEALRYAVDHSMHVAYLRYGQEPREAVK